MSEFYCQREIECNTPCETQCDHCKKYYSPIENTYRGYTIDISDMGLWGQKYKYEFYPTDYDGESVGHGETIEDCKTQIDESYE